MEMALNFLIESFRGAGWLFYYSGPYLCMIFGPIIVLKILTNMAVKKLTPEIPEPEIVYIHHYHDEEKPKPNKRGKP